MSSFPSVVAINSIDLPVLNYRDHRVITTEYLAQLYGTETVRIRQNHVRNADRFEQDRHFFKIEGDELSSLKILGSKIDKHTTSIILWTERGAARHAKMLETDQAWNVFEKLESAYFDGAIQSASLPPVSTPHILESSLVLDYRGIPIRFLIDETGYWQATYKDVATALGYVGDAYTAARLLLKNSIKPGDRHLRHPLYGDLISLSGLETAFAQCERSRAYSPDRADNAKALRHWIAGIAAPLVAQPASAGRLLARPAGQLVLASDPDYQQSSQLLSLWYQSLGESPYRAADVLQRASGDLAAALTNVARNRWFSTQFSAKRLGKWLSLRQGKSVDGLVIHSDIDRSRHVRLWAVRQGSA